MYEIIKKNWYKTKFIASFGIALTLLILITVIYKNDNKGSARLRCERQLCLGHDSRD